MREKTLFEEQQQVKEIESLRQRHGEVMDEIDQVFVRISCHLMSPRNPKLFQ